MTDNSSRKLPSETSLLEEALILINDIQTEGFDMEAGETWIYPTNYSLRDYQFNIIQEALFKNTMVSLPTGLGKTFIAAVVMYNFYRWYPRGKIIFMAPTRPLVKQQIDACYNIMAIPVEVTAELTGTKAQNCRKEIWNTKRVFFITPQVLQNDLNILNELGTKIKCLVFDEAHKAKGNHAYCQVIRKLIPINSYFRVLALSATPGNTLDDVLEVIHNLLISHLEIRTDESQDVVPYIFQRTLETVVIPLGGKLQQIRDWYIQILEKYSRVLVQNKIISGNCAALTKGKIFLTLKSYKERNQTSRDTSYAENMRYLNICITLYHAYDLLIRHGLRGFLSFFEDHVNNSLMRGIKEIHDIMDDVKLYLGPAPNIEPLPDGTILDISKETKFGHPKFYKLLDILLNHFNNPNNNASRVIVFCEYRESVMEAYALLLQHRSLIKPRTFLGQGAISQRQQMAVVTAFRKGECNTLISTCIGEEGLDVGSVDLIICFDINSRSPVRMVQRMGRTGRQREGQVVVLVTEGKEQQTLKECLIHKQNLTDHILQSSALYQNMYKQNPRMVPNDIYPQCQKLFITVKPNIKPRQRRNAKIKDMLDYNVSAKDFNLRFEGIDETSSFENRLPSKQEFWSKANPLNVNSIPQKLDFSTKISKLRVLQPTGEIGHSRSSELLTSLLQFGDSKRYNIPITQVPVMPSQIAKTFKKTTSSSNLIQTDIRNIFAKVVSSGTDLISEEVKISNDKNLEKYNFNKLSKEIATYLELEPDDSCCKICANLFHCSQIDVKIEFDITSLSEPDLSLLNGCNIKSFEYFTNFLKADLTKLNPPMVTKEEYNHDCIKSVTPVVNIYERTYLKPIATIGSKITPLKHPKNIEKVLSRCGITPNLDDSLFDNVSFTQFEKKNATCSENRIKESLPITQSFLNAEFTQLKKDSNSTQDLKFFNVERLDDIFEDDDPSQKTIIYSPSESVDKINKSNEKVFQQDINTSPILCSYDGSHRLKNAVNKKLFDAAENYNSLQEDESFTFHNIICSSPVKNADSRNCVQEIHEQASTTFRKVEIETSISFGKNNASTNINRLSDLSEFADLEVFGLDKSFAVPSESSKAKSVTVDPLVDFVEDSFLDIFMETFEDAEKKNIQTSTDNNVSKDEQKNDWEVSTNSGLNNFPGSQNCKYETQGDIFIETSPVRNRSYERITNTIQNDGIVVDFAPSTSPVLSCRLSQISRSDSTKTKSSINKLSTMTRNTNKIINEKEQAITVNKQHVDLDESFYFTFSTKKTPRINNRLSTSNSSGSPVLQTKSQSHGTRLTQTPKSSIKAITISSDSDDDFEKPTSSAPKVKLKPRNIMQTIKHDRIEKRPLGPNQNIQLLQRKHSKRKKLGDCEYFDVEAELELDENATSDSSDDSDYDKFEASFVDDDTQNIANTTLTHAQYLKSVRSPINRGMFKIPQAPPPVSTNIYSQLVDEEDNTYVNDSFCVDSEEEEVFSQETVSELEVAELVLATEKRNSKRTGNKISDRIPRKRRRIMIIGSDSDE